MPKVKRFTAVNAFMPNEWCEVVGAPSHVRQINALALAYTKADLTGLIEDRTRERGDYIAADFKLQRDGRVGNHWQEAIDAGIIDPDQPGIYITESGGRINDVIVRVEPDGTYVTVAHWRFADGKQYGRLAIQKGAPA